MDSVTLPKVPALREHTWHAPISPLPLLTTIRGGLIALIPELGVLSTKPHASSGGSVSNGGSLALASGPMAPPRGVASRSFWDAKKCVRGVNQSPRRIGTFFC